MSALPRDGMPLIMLSNMRLRQCDKEIQMTRKKLTYVIIQYPVKHTEVNGLLELTTKIGTLTKMFLHVKNILVNAKRLTRLV